MAEVDKLICFNGFHILLVILISVVVINNKFDFIINVINYIINIDAPGFWFLMIHIILAYIILTSIKIQLGFRAAVNFNL
jgi:hypothetical protein